MVFWCLMGSSPGSPSHRTAFVKYVLSGAVVQRAIMFDLMEYPYPTLFRLIFRGFKRGLMSLVPGVPGIHYVDILVQ